jgi:UDP-N-acetyl-D-galactosamine dehydrogenase
MHRDAAPPQQVTAATVVAVVGLGYVGLPLAAAFGRRYRTLGFDLSAAKLASYRAGRDPTGQVSDAALAEAKRLEYTGDAAALGEADLIVVAVPTPVDEAKRPDFAPLARASEEVGRRMKRGATVIYESTVYPGATEEVCIPLLERASGLAWKRDFFVGYSPERINPGDREHGLEKIIKVVAGDTPETLERVAALYASVVPAGVHRAQSIRVAEAAKVIENTQRDLNIALVNELAILFDRLGLDTSQVLEAAGTKWNFARFRPGLVGGHCIGVDPYYLTHKAESVGYHPQVILAGRRINDGMGKFIAAKTVKLLAEGGTSIKGARIAILGLAYKEDVPDIRNSRVPDIVRELAACGAEVHVHDPVAEPADAAREYGIALASWDSLPVADALIVAVAHRDVRAVPVETLKKKVKAGGCVLDVKACLDRDALERAGLRVWRL